MRSWPRLMELGLAVLLAACGTDSAPAEHAPPDDNMPTPVDPSACETSYLTYDNFGAPFVINWCRGCHSDAVPPAMRQKAPTDANFDTLAEVQMWSDRIASKVTGMAPTMPPAGGPSDEERALLAEWLACGAK